MRRVLAWSLPVTIRSEVSDHQVQWLKFRQAESLDLDRCGINEVNLKEPTWTKPRQVVRKYGLSLENYREEFEGQIPVILDRAYEKMPCTKEGWVESSLIEPFKDERVVFVAHEASEKGHKERTLSAKLGTFVKNVNKNSQRAWSYVRDDFFLQRHPDLLASCPLLPSMFGASKKTKTKTVESLNQFELLPKLLRPQAATLLWGGRYSRSKLHVDRYNWTGTNVVIRGEKFVRLIPPGGHDQHLEVQRLTCPFIHGVCSQHVFGTSMPARTSSVIYVKINHESVLPGRLSSKGLPELYGFIS